SSLGSLLRLRMLVKAFGHHLLYRGPGATATAVAVTGDTVVEGDIARRGVLRAEVVPHPADVLHQVPWRPVTGGKGRPGGPGLGAVDHPFPPVVTRVIEVGQHGALSPDTSVPRTTALRRVSRRQLEQPAGAVERTRLGGLGGPFQLPLVAGDLFRQQGGLGRHIGANTYQQQEDHRDEQDHALLAPGGY